MSVDCNPLTAVRRIGGSGDKVIGGRVVEAHTSVGQVSTVASVDTLSSSGLASAGRLREDSLSSPRQAHSHPGVVVRYIFTEKGGGKEEKPPRITATQ